MSDRHFKKRPKGQQSEKQYMRKKRNMRSEAKKSNVKDDSQDFRLNKVEKRVKELDKATKGFAGAGGSSAIIATLIGQSPSTVLDSFTLSGTGYLSDVNNASNKQVGNVVDDFFAIKHIGLNYHIDMDPEILTDDVGVSMLVRVVVLVVHQMLGQPGDSGGSLSPNMSDIFIMPEVGNMTSSDVHAHYTRLMRNNFEVLYDKTHVLSPSVNTVPDGGTVQAGTASPFTQTFKLNLNPSKRSQQVKLNNTVAAGALRTTSRADTAQNVYYLLAFTDNPQAANAQAPTITYNWVVDYLD